MRAVILAGGLGTRLRPYTTVLPKPLMPVGDRPVLDIVVRQLKRAGCERITISTGYLAELIEAFFRDGSRYEIPIDYYREREPLGTIGSLAMIAGIDDDCLVMNGDILTDLDYSKMWAEHRTNDAVLTIATRVNEVEIPLGVLQFGDGGDPTRLTGYVEKPRIDYTASMGVFCLSPEAIRYIDPGERLDLPDFVLRLLDNGQTVRAWLSTDYWLDMGRPEDYEQAVENYVEIQSRLLPHDEPHPEQEQSIGRMAQ